MLPIISLLQVLQSKLTSAKILQLADFLYCFMCIRYGVSVRSLSRYSNYSVRTWFRFLAEDYPWVSIRVKLFLKWVYKEQNRYILAIDEVVEGKSRDKTHGLSKFWSSIQKRPISGICFFCATIIAVGNRKPYPMAIEQVVHTEEDKNRIAEQKKRTAAGKRRSAEGRCLVRGRKKGSKNQPKQPNPTASYRAFTTLLSTLLSCLSGINLTYLVADGAYASADYLLAVRNVGLHLITRLPANVALVLPYTAAQKHKKKPKKYGEKVDLNKLDKQYLKDTKTEDDLLIQTWQLPCYNKSTSKNLLNVVVVKATNFKTKKVAFSILCTTDPTLDWQTMTDYYSLRFQIEFDFRDAKQFFGLSDFKNYTPKNLTNFVNLSFLATLVAKMMQAQYQVKYNHPNFSILDLKILFSARFTVKAVIKLVQKSPQAIFNPHFADEFMPTDLVNAA